MSSLAQKARKARSQNRITFIFKLLGVYLLDIRDLCLFERLNDAEYVLNGRFKILSWDLQILQIHKWWPNLKRIKIESRNASSALKTKRSVSEFS